MFIRFVRPNTVEGTNAREGFFCAAYELRDNPSTDAHTLARLEQLLSWFREHLPIPGDFSRSKSKRDFSVTKGLSWFKPSAGEVLDRSHELIILLQDNGYSIQTLKSSRIGYVIYEDEVQVVAEPFSDTPT